MTKDALEKRLAELRKNFAKIEANGNATIGAITECEYWLAQLSQPKKQEPASLDSIAGSATAR